jgi:hypothetical protein
MLAVHFEASRDLPARGALPAAGGRVDSRRHAKLEAEGHLLHARELGARLSGPERSRLDLALLERLGRTRRSRGDMRASAEAFEALIAAAGEFGDQRTQVRALLYHIEHGLLAGPRALPRVGRSRGRDRGPGRRLAARGARAQAHRGHAYMNLRGFAAGRRSRNAGARSRPRAWPRIRCWLALHRVRFAYAELCRAPTTARLQQAEDGAEHGPGRGDGFDYLLARFFRAWALLYAACFGDLALTLDEGRQLAARTATCCGRSSCSCSTRATLVADARLRARARARGPDRRAARERPLESRAAPVPRPDRAVRKRSWAATLQQRPATPGGDRARPSRTRRRVDGLLLYLPLRHLRPSTRA